MSIKNLKVNEMEDIPNSIKYLFPEDRKFKRIGVEPDGSCLFHAFFYCKEDNYRDLNTSRRDIIIKKKRVEFSNKLKDELQKTPVVKELETLKEVLDVSENTTESEFLDQMKNTSFWGNEEAIISLEYIYKINIVVFQYNYEKNKTDLYCRSQTLNAEYPTIILFNNENVHFEPIIEILKLNNQKTRFIKNDKLITNINKEIQNCLKGTSSKTISNNDDKNEKQNNETKETENQKEETNKQENNKQANDKQANDKQANDKQANDKQANDKQENDKQENNKQANDKQENNKQANDKEENDKQANAKNISNTSNDDMIIRYIKDTNIRYTENSIKTVDIKILKQDNDFIDYSKEKLLIEIVKLLSYKKYDDDITNILRSNMFDLYNNYPISDNINLLYNKKFIPIVSIYKKYYKEDESDFINISDNDLLKYNITRISDYLKEYSNIKKDKDTNFYDIEKKLYLFQRNTITDTKDENDLIVLTTNIDVYSQQLLNNIEDELLIIENKYDIKSGKFRILKEQNIDTQYSELEFDCKLNRESIKHNLEKLNEKLYGGDKVKIIGFVTSNKIINNIEEENIIDLNNYFDDILALSIGDEVILEFNNLFLFDKTLKGKITNINENKYNIKLEKPILENKSELIYNLNSYNNGFYMFNKKKHTKKFNKSQLLNENYIVLLYKHSIDITLNIINYTIIELLSLYENKIFNIEIFNKVLKDFGYNLNNLNIQDINKLIEIIEKNTNSVAKYQKKYNLKKSISNYIKFSNILNYDSEIIKKTFKEEKIKYENFDKYLDNNLSRFIFINKQNNLGYKYFIENFISKYIEEEEKEYISDKIDINTQIGLSQENIKRQKEKLSNLSNNCNKIKITYHFTSLNELNNKMDVESGLYAMVHLDNFKKIYKKTNDKWDYISLIRDSNSIAKCNDKISLIYDEFKENNCIYDKYDNICITSEHLKIKNTIIILEKQIDVLKDIIAFLKVNLNNNLVIKDEYNIYKYLIENSRINNVNSFTMRYKSKDTRNFTGSEDLIDFEENNLNIDNYENPGSSVINFNDEKKIENIKDEVIKNNLILLENILIYTGLNYKLNLTNTEKLYLINILPKLVNIIWSSIKTIIIKDLKKKMTQNAKEKLLEQEKKFMSDIQKSFILSALIIIIFQNRRNTIKIFKNEYNINFVKYYSLENEKKIIKYFSLILLEYLPNEDLQKFDKNYKENIEKSLNTCISKIKENKSLYISLIKADIESEIELNKLNNVWESFKPKLVNYNKLNNKSIISQYISSINLLIKATSEDFILNDKNLLQFFDYTKIDKDINFYNNLNLSKNIVDNIRQLDRNKISNYIYELFVLYNLNLNRIVPRITVIFDNLQKTHITNLLELKEDEDIDKTKLINQNEYLNKYKYDIINLLVDGNEKDWGNIIQYNFDILNNLSQNIDLDDYIISNLNRLIANPNNIRKNITELDKLNIELENFLIYDLKELIINNLIIRENKIYISKEFFEEHQYSIIKSIVNKSKENLSQIDNKFLLNETDITYLKILNLMNTMLNSSFIANILNLATTDNNINSSIKKLYMLLYIILIFIIELYLMIEETTINIDNNKIFDDLYESIKDINKLKLMEQLSKLILNRLNSKLILNIRTSDELQRCFEKLREDQKKSQLDVLNKLSDSERTMYIQKKNILGIKNLDFFDEDPDKCNEIQLYEEKKKDRYEEVFYSNDDNDDNLANNVDYDLHLYSD